MLRVTYSKVLHLCKVNSFFIVCRIRYYVTYRKGAACIVAIVFNSVKVVCNVCVVLYTARDVILYV